MKIEEIISTTARMRSAQLAKNIQMNNLLDAMLKGIKPRKLTRDERLVMEVDELIQRLDNAAKVLDGLDICECD